MRVVFVGAGAVGGYFGARMAAAGLDVAFFLRPESARALRESGLVVSSPLGDVQLSAPRVLEPGLPAPEPDLLFFACRAAQVRSAAELALPLVGPATIAVPLQNGVAAPATLAEVYGAGAVIGGLSRIFAERVQPGRIVHMTLRPSITVGERAGGISERVRQLVETLAPVPGMSIDASDDVWTAMWVKLLMVCTIGAVGAAARAPLGVLLEVPQTRRALEVAGDEIAAVARASGARIPEGFTGRQLPNYSKLPPETTASMHRDLERGDPSELRAQLGSVCEAGRRKAVPTPALDTLFGALLPGELRARGRIAYENVRPRMPGR